MKTEFFFFTILRNLKKVLNWKHLENAVWSREATIDELCQVVEPYLVRLSNAKWNYSRAMPNMEWVCNRRVNGVLDSRVSCWISATPYPSPHIIYHSYDLFSNKKWRENPKNENVPKTTEFSIHPLHISQWISGMPPHSFSLIIKVKLNDASPHCINCFRLAHECQSTQPPEKRAIY